MDVIPYDVDNLLRVVQIFLCNAKAPKFTTIPSPTEWTLDSEAAYVRYCANETVNVVELHYTPDVGKTPLVGIDVRMHACIYVGLQKPDGPLGWW